MSTKWMPLSLSSFLPLSLSIALLSSEMAGNVALGACCVLIFEIVWHLSSKVFPGVVAMSVDDGAPIQQCSQAANQAAKQLAQLAAKQPRASRVHGNLQLQFSEIVSNYEEELARKRRRRCR